MCQFEILKYSNVDIKKYKNEEERRKGKQQIRQYTDTLTASPKHMAAWWKKRVC